MDDDVLSIDTYRVTRSHGRTIAAKTTLTMSTKKKERKTVQVRVSKKIHKMLRALALEEKMTMSKLVDLSIKSYINRNY